MSLSFPPFIPSKSARRQTRARGGENLNKEQLTAEYDEMKRVALLGHLHRVDVEVLRYKKLKEVMKEWYDHRKAQL